MNKFLKIMNNSNCLSKSIKMEKMRDIGQKLLRVFVIFFGRFDCISAFKAILARYLFV